MDTNTPHVDEFTHLSAKISDYVIITGHLISHVTVALTCYDARQDRNGNLSCDVDTFIINRKKSGFFKLIEQMNDKMRVVHTLPFLAVHSDWHINFPDQTDDDLHLHQKFLSRQTAHIRNASSLPPKLKGNIKPEPSVDTTLKMEFINPSMNGLRINLRLPHEQWNLPSVKGAIRFNINHPNCTLNSGQFLASWQLPHIPQAISAKRQARSAKVIELDRRRYG